jgi:hypothetical protein
MKTIGIGLLILGTVFATIFGAVTAFYVAGRIIVPDLHRGYVPFWHIFWALVLFTVIGGAVPLVTRAATVD